MTINESTWLLSSKSVEHGNSESSTEGRGSDRIIDFGNLQILMRDFAHQTIAKPNFDLATSFFSSFPPRYPSLFLLPCLLDSRPKFLLVCGNSACVHHIFLIPQVWSGAVYQETCIRAACAFARPRQYCSSRGFWTFITLKWFLSSFPSSFFSFPSEALGEHASINFPC